MHYTGMSRQQASFTVRHCHLQYTQTTCTNLAPALIAIRIARFPIIEIRSLGCCICAFSGNLFPHSSNLVHDSIFDSLGNSHRVLSGIDSFELTTRLYCVILLSSLQERMSYSCRVRFLHVTSPFWSRDSFPSIDRYPESPTKPQYPWYSHSSPLQP